MSVNTQEHMDYWFNIDLSSSSDTCIKIEQMKFHRKQFDPFYGSAKETYTQRLLINYSKPKNLNKNHLETQTSGTSLSDMKIY